MQRPLWYKDQIADAEKTALHVNRSIKQYKYDERQMVADPIEAMEVVCENFHATNLERSKLIEQIDGMQQALAEVHKIHDQDGRGELINFGDQHDAAFQVERNADTSAFIVANAQCFNAESTEDNLLDLIEKIHAYDFTDGDGWAMVSSLFDTGANCSLHNTQIGDFYWNSKDVQIPITAFDGSTNTGTSKQGEYWCYFMSTNPAYKGSRFKGTGNVVDGLPLNIFSVLASKRHEDMSYSVNLGTMPENADERQTDFCGCFRVDESTGERVNIPARYSADRLCWFNDAIYAKTAEEAERVGEMIEKVLQQDSHENVQKSLMNCMANTSQVVLEYVSKTGSAARYVSGTQFGNIDSNGKQCLMVNTCGALDREIQIRLDNPDEQFLNFTVMTLDPHEDILRFNATQFDIEHSFIDDSGNIDVNALAEKLEQYSRDGLTCISIDALVPHEDKSKDADDRLPATGCECCDHAEQCLHDLNLYMIEMSEVETEDANSESSSDEEMPMWARDNPFAALMGDSVNHAGDVQYETTENVMAGVKNTMHHSIDRKMTALQMHMKCGHTGSHPDCIQCRTTSKTLRRVHTEVDPYREIRPGATWSGDIVYWNVESIKGNKYTAVFRDDASDKIVYFNMSTRKDTTAKMESMITELRNNPSFAWIEKMQWKLFGHCRLDLAGEWDDRCAEFVDMRKRLGITVEYAQPGHEGNHRSASRGENVVKQVELATKKIMIACSLPANLWEWALEAAVQLMNIFPTSRRVTSKDGDAARPDEILSNGAISRRFCNHMIHYFENPGVPALVSTPDIKGSNLMQPNRVRKMIRMGMTSTLPKWVDPDTGRIVRSKDYIVLTLKSGQSAWQYYGCDNQPDMPNYITVQPSNFEQISSIHIDDTWTLGDADSDALLTQQNLRLEDGPMPRSVGQGPQITVVPAELPVKLDKPEPMPSLSTLEPSVEDSAGPVEESDPIRMKASDFPLADPESVIIDREFRKQFAELKAAGKIPQSIEYSSDQPVLSITSIIKRPGDGQFGDPKLDGLDGQFDDPKLIGLDLQFGDPKLDGPVDENSLEQTVASKVLDKLSLKLPRLSTEREQNIADLCDNASRFIGCKGYKYFPQEPEKGVQVGTVILTDYVGNVDTFLTDTSTSDGSAFWRVAFTETYSEDWTDSEMQDHCIDFIHGTDKLPIIPMENDNKIVTTSGLHQYMTADGDDFIDICTAMGIQRDMWRIYYHWLDEVHCYGHRHRTSENGIYFYNPWRGVGHKAKLKTVGKQTRHNSGRPFPYPKGDLWKKMVHDHMMASTELAGLAARLTNMSFVTIMEYEKFRAHLERDHEKYENLLQNIAMTLDIEEDDSQQNMQFDLVCAALDNENAEHAYTVLDHESDNPDISDTNDTQWPEAINNRYTDASGKIVAPKNVADAQSRDDWPMWERAFNKEQNGLDKLGVYEHDLTLGELKEKGYDHKPVTQMVLFTAKYSPKGKFEKAKCRIVVRGHKYAMKQGVHYHATFAASPKDGSVRLLQALMCHETRKFHRLCWDIVQAFPKAPLKPSEMIILCYPKGQERSLKDGTPLYSLLRMNLYGSPAANRYFCMMRDKWIMSHFNDSMKMPGWSVEQMRYDACMFHFTSPTKKSVYAVIHTDDIDSICDSMKDGTAVMNAFDEKFTIVVLDPDFMLGILRTVSTDADGHLQVVLTQPDFIDCLVKNFEHVLPKSAAGPTPTNFFLSTRGNAKGELPTATESAEVLANGYQSGVGSMLWASRRCHPSLSFGTSMLCRVMSRPSFEAQTGLRHMIKYIERHRDKGIRYSAKFKGSPTCYYDASNKSDPSDSKAQYGWIVFMFGGPLLWASKKHKHVGVQGSMQNEYMAAGQACRQLAWLRFLLHEMKLDEFITSPTPLLGDNDPCTRMIWNDIITDGNQFFWREYHFAKECYERGLIWCLRVDTKENHADFLTKAKSGVEIEKEDPRIRGYETMAKEVPEQPIGQHRVQPDFEGRTDPSYISVDEFNFDNFEIHVPLHAGRLDAEGDLSTNHDEIWDYIDMCPGLQIQTEADAADEEPSHTSTASGGQL